MENDPRQETDPQEIEASRRVYEYLSQAIKIGNCLDELAQPRVGSRLRKDDSRVPTRRVSDYVHGQLTVASGCLESLNRMIAQKNGDMVEMAASPFGPYALIRNALDSLAVAIWLMQPESGTLRIKRLLQLHREEIQKQSFYMESMGREADANSFTKRQFDRLEEIALEAELGDWNPMKKSNKLISATQMLKDIDESGRKSNKWRYLGFWQAASGHAHGKVWATVGGHESEVIPGTEHGTGATYRITISYVLLSSFMWNAVDMLERAFNRYCYLAGHEQVIA